MVRIELHVQLMENLLQDHLRFSAAAKYNFGLLWRLSSKESTAIQEWQEMQVQVGPCCLSILYTRVCIYQS